MDLKKLQLCLIGFVSLVSVCAVGSDRVALMKSIWMEDFESGTISGWASYPAMEDTAYDFTILPGYYRPQYALQGSIFSGGEFHYPLELAPPKKPAGNDFYLLRAYRPNSPSPQRIGMACKLSLFLAEDFQFSFDFWLKPHSTPVRLRVELAGADGRRYSCLIDRPGQGHWQRIELPRRHLRSEERIPDPNLEIQAISIIAEVQQGDPSAYFYFAIDNVSMQGRRLPKLRLIEPETRSYKHWSKGFSQKHYYPGDELQLSVEPEVALKEIFGRLVHFNGQLVGGVLRFEKSGGLWVCDSPYVFQKQDNRGPLTLRLEGRTETNELIRGETRLWFLERPDAGAHPRLFFSEEDRQVLIDRCQSEKYQAIWQSIVDQAQEARAKPIMKEAQIRSFSSDYLLQELIPYFTVLRETARGGLYNAWVYWIEGDEKAGRYARDVLLKMANWEQWVHPWFHTQGRKSYYPLGIVCQELAIVYDLIYPLLATQDRRAIYQGIMRNGIINSYEEYFVDNRIPNHTSNWISGAAAGPLLMLLAFYGEESVADDRTHGEPYFSGLAEKWLAHVQATLKEDGSYGEGVAYQNFAYEMGLPTLAAMEKVFGVNELAEALHWQQSYLYPLYVTMRDLTVVDMGDSGYDPLREMSNFSWLMYRQRGPVLKWLYELNPGKNWRDLLWMENPIQSLSPAEEALIPSRYFPDKGNVVFRTGWDDQDIMLLYRAGPNFNHTHFDQGSFLLWGFGEKLAFEGGKTDYYDDPYYWSYFIQAAAHNTILIDDNPESQEVGDFANEVKAFDRHARISTALMDEECGLLSSEIGMLYRGLLSRLTRRLVFLETGVVVIHDTIRSKSGPHRYQFQYHPPRKAGLTLTNKGAIYQGDKARLSIYAIRPSQAQFVVKDTPLPLWDSLKFPGKPLHERAVLQITHERPVNDQEFLIVLIPDNGEQVQPLEMEDLSGKGFQGVAFKEDERRRHEVYFSLENEIQGSFLTDADSAWLSYNANTIERMLVERAQVVILEGRTFFEADAPVDLMLKNNGKEHIWMIEAKQRTIIEVLCATDSYEISGTGNALSLENGKLVLEIDKGRVKAKVKL